MLCSALTWPHKQEYFRVMRNAEKNALLGVDIKKLHLTTRQALVWALRAQGIPQAQIASEWGSSRANICNLERCAREKVEKSRATIAFDEQLRAPLQLVCYPGELLLDIPPRLYRIADQSEIKVSADGPMVMQRVLLEATDCIRDNRFVRPVLLLVSLEGKLLVRPMVVT